MPSWLITDPEPFDEFDLGPLKTGKEAEVFLVERIAPDGRSCLLAHKRYRPRIVTHKGELQELGFQRAASFVNDAAYRDGRKIPNSRDRRAVAKRTKHGRDVLRDDWPANEFAVLTRLHEAGVVVPYPVDRSADGLLMQYLGDRTRAAPRLVQAGLERDGVKTAAAQLVENLMRMVTAGIVHADLSVYNLLWWDETLWIIDVPQAVDIGANLQAFDLLLRDLRNVGGWFESKGVEFNADRLLSELVAVASIT
jgi:RIO kinase 1